jgi:hypothetical protein
MNGNTGSTQGLKMVSTPPMYDRTNISMMCQATL